MIFRYAAIFLITFTSVLNFSCTTKQAVRSGAEFVLNAEIPNEINGDTVLQFTIDMIVGGRFDMVIDTILPGIMKGAELAEAVKKANLWRFDIRFYVVWAGCLTGADSVAKARAVQEILRKIIPEITAWVKEWIAKKEAEKADEKDIKAVVVRLGLDLGLNWLLAEIDKCIEKIPTLHSSPNLVKQLADLTQEFNPKEWKKRTEKGLACA